MNTEYEIIFSADLGSLIPAVGELSDSLNLDLANFGVDEKLSIRSKFIAGLLKSDRDLTNAEIEKVKQVIIDTFHRHQPAWRVKIESFRRKSGNVQQLVSQ